jgi:hypothetical protein
MAIGDGLGEFSDELLTIKEGITINDGTRVDNRVWHVRFYFIA